MKIAEPGTIVLPLLSSNGRVAVEAEGDTPHDGDNDDVIPKPSEMPEIDPARCLFCGARNGTFESNLAHMSKEHSFVIPYQDYLEVEPETLVEYLQVAIYGYGECILCATRRNTVEGIQHHMMAKGHCRLNFASNVTDLYNIPEKKFQAAGELLRLPSGRLTGPRGSSTGGTLRMRGRSLGESRRMEPIRSPLRTPSHE